MASAVGKWLHGKDNGRLAEGCPWGVGPLCRVGEHGAIPVYAGQSEPSHPDLPVRQVRGQEMRIWWPQRNEVHCGCTTDPVTGEWLTDSGTTSCPQGGSACTPVNPAFPACGNCETLRLT